ncbi:MAG: NAD(P)H-dependent oxidoreductase subunit E [Oscillospiraceae bacterium]|nr:NAD(P)H-dependent oxidoreductase subunit E [Oscillospiraceae bacterium]
MAEENRAEQMLRLQQAIAEHAHEKGAVMVLLQAAQSIFGHVPQDVQQMIADATGASLSEVYGVATFYAQFSLEPGGEHEIGVCLGTACYVKGSQKLLDKLSELLAVAPGKTTADAKFTLKATRCLGACGLAPVLMVDDEVYGRLVPEDVPGILAKYLGQ